MTAALASIAVPAAAQVDVGGGSQLKNMVSAAELEAASKQQYDKMLADARAQNALAREGNPQLERLQVIARRIIPFTYAWNDAAKRWQWEINLIGSKQINAFCMPGGKIAFYTGILNTLALTDDETAMVMGHEMAHALREHARARVAKNAVTQNVLSLGAQLFGFGQLGDIAANIGTQLITLRFSREDETEADLIGLELAARAGYNPNASVTLWEKMAKAAGSAGPGFLSTHPTGPDRIRQLQANIPKVQGLYEQARKTRG